MYTSRGAVQKLIYLTEKLTLLYSVSLWRRNSIRDSYVNFE